MLTTTAGLHWLASSERERQQALEIARALQQKESRDELGIGSIRDGVADLLFPGTSTLHTRARYFLLIPWAYQQAAAHRGSSPLAARVRSTEAQLIATLKASDHNAGLIGRDAGADLKRMPSTLYWQGLYVWNIRSVGGPQSTIERILAGRTGPRITDDDGEALDAQGLQVWHPNLPPPPEGHPAGASFALTHYEADFLAERLLTEPTTRASVLAGLMTSSVNHGSVANIWGHPDLGLLSGRMRELIEQARLFSLLMYGAALLYNVLLAELDERDELAGSYRDDMDEWAADVEAEAESLSEWALGELWEATNHVVPAGTRRFVGQWQGEFRQAGPTGLVDSATARALIAAREQSTKGANARTRNAKALKQWGGASATAPLDFRWSTARVLLDDIRAGLDRSDAQH
ncbi:MAG: DUF6361 family protein [Solirubrobacteraceae bacterium]